MFANIVGFGPLCFQNSSWIKAKQIHVFQIFLTQESIFHVLNIMNYKLIKSFINGKYTTYSMTYMAQS